MLALVRLRQYLEQHAIAMSSPETGSMPVIFVAHGAPMLLDDATWVAELSDWAQQLPRPRAVLMVSAHWEAQPVALGATHPVPLIYDFYGFPQRFYELAYAAPAAPELAERVRGLLHARSVEHKEAPERGLDHGAYVPLMCMYPEADVPVLQISLPGLEPAPLLELGRALAPLREEGVLIVGSGFLTHNMRYAFRRGTPSWANEFDAWVKEALLALDVDALLDFRQRAPGVGMALPTIEHFVPVIVALGAALASKPRVTFPITGFWFDGAFTRRSVQFE